MTAHNASVSLNVTDVPTTGYIQATLNANTPNPMNKSYYYKYSGGDDGNGNVTEKGRGKITISLTLNSGPRYAISTIGDGGTQTQLTYQVSDALHATITDKNDKVENDYYNVLISDTGNIDSNRNACQFWCDPRVDNEN